MNYFWEERHKLGGSQIQGGQGAQKHCLVFLLKNAQSPLRGVRERKHIKWLTTCLVLAMGRNGEHFFFKPVQINRTGFRKQMCAQSLSRVRLCDSVDCSPPGSSVHWIFLEQILEWVAIPSSRGSSQPRDWTQVSCISCMAGRYFTAEPPGKPLRKQAENQMNLDNDVFLSGQVFQERNSRVNSGTYLN